MKPVIITLKVLIPLLILTTKASSQDLQPGNQNVTRNNLVGNSTAPGFNFSFSPVFSTSLNGKNDSLLFRGSGGGIKFGGDYFFGKAGVGISSGFGSSSPDNSTINEFLRKTNIPIDQLSITKSNQQNMYLLLGPSIRFGNAVELMLHAKGGLFINNGGLMMVQQRGSTKTIYGNESTNKSVYPGFQTGLNIQYSTKSDVWSFGICADYMGTKTEVNNYDARRGGGIEGLQLSKNISDLIAGVTIRYSIRSSPREQGTGLATGRLLPTVNKRESSTGMATGRLLPTVNKREASTGMATGRLLPTVNKKEIAIDEPGVQKNISQSCGPVTVKTTQPDGSITEQTFSCPKDALDYAKKIDDKKQKQWLPANFRTGADQGANNGIISGSLTWPVSGALGIITNKNINDASGTNKKPVNSIGTSITITAREASTGMATGRRSREASTGMASGKLSEMVFSDGDQGNCDSCVVSIKSNPLHGGIGTAQNNPMYQRTIGNDGDCNDGIEGIDVSLIDVASGAVLAKTKTGSCGDFFFANVPRGNYIVKVNGVVAGKKGYDVYTRSKTDLLGDIKLADESVELIINAGAGSTNATAINNSHSNIKNLSLVEADLDGDGAFESIRVQGTFSDGTTNDITSDAKTTGGNKSVVLGGESFRMRRRVEVLKSNKADLKSKQLINITLSPSDLDGDGYRETENAKATFSDGTTQDVTDAMVINTSHPGIKQYNITVADTDGDGIADGVIKTKTKSNQSNDRIAVGDVSGDGLPDAIINTSRSNIKNRVASGDVTGDGYDDAIWSPRSNVMLLRVASGDVNGDGVDELLIGNKVTAFDMQEESGKSFFETGDKPTSSQRMPSDPIPGVDVKLGKNPGGEYLLSTTTNGEGKFQFKNLDAGNYFITTEQNILIDNETVVTVRGDVAENINTSESNLKESKVSSSQNSQTLKTQNNNTVRSNRPEFGMAIIQADLDGDGIFESSYLSATGEIATIAIDEPGQAKIVEKEASDLRQIMQSQTTNQANDQSKSTPFPVKWSAPESINKKVWGDPHVDQKDGSLRLGEGNFGTVNKSKWKSTDVAIKTVRCADGTCRIITSNTTDFPDITPVSSNNFIHGSPINNAAVWFSDDKGKIYKTTTDNNGRVGLNGLPTGVPLKMIVNIAVEGTDDIIVKFIGNKPGGNMYLLKVSHDMAMSSIRNLKG